MGTIVGPCGSLRRATPGSGGTALSQAAWLPVLRTLGTRPWFDGRVLISGASKTFDTNGRVVDTVTHDRIRTRGRICGVC